MADKAQQAAPLDDLAAAIRAEIPYPSTWPAGDVDKWATHYAERILARLAPAQPAVPPADIRLYPEPAQARPADAALPNKKENAMDLLEAAWGIIANANGGNWETANAEWRDAAIRWREAYFAALAQQPTAAEDV